MGDTDLDKKVAGSIKEAIGTVTGDGPLRTEGKADKEAAETPPAEKLDKA